MYLLMNQFNMAVFAEGGAWTFGKMLSAIQKTVGNYGKVIVGIIGLVMVLVSIYQIAKNLISHGKAQTNWVITFALLLVGGVLMLSNGWSVIKSVTTGGSSTINNLGQGTSDDTAQFQEPFAIIDGNLIEFN